MISIITSYWIGKIMQISWKFSPPFQESISSVPSLSCVQLWPHRLQHTKFPCPSPTPWSCSNSYPLNQWYHPTISSSVIPFFSCLQSFPVSGSFQWVSSSHQVIKYWSFSFSICFSNEYSGLSSFRMDWVDLLAVQGTLNSIIQTTVQKHQFFGTQLSLWSNFPSAK